jgi:hypothetical protein
MNQTYILEDDGGIIPICQRCMKSTSFYPAEAPHSTGCFCTNPIITDVAKSKQNEYLHKQNILSRDV